MPSSPPSPRPLREGGRSSSVEPKGSGKARFGEQHHPLGALERCGHVPRAPCAPGAAAVLFVRHLGRAGQMLPRAGEGETEVGGSVSLPLVPSCFPPVPAPAPTQRRFQPRPHSPQQLESSWLH